MSKMLKITMIIVIAFFSIILTPHERASANPLAVGGALYLGGAGIYVVGTLGVAAVAGLVELDSCPSCQEDMEQHAHNVWNGATQTAKDALQLMVDASVGAGASLTATDANFNSWLDTQIDGIIGESLSYKYGNINADSSSYTKNANTSTTSGLSAKNGRAFLVAGSSYANLTVYKNANYFDVWVSSKLSGAGASTVWLLNSTKPSDYTEVNNLLRTALDSATYASLLSTIQLTTPISFGINSEYQASYANVNANTREAWEDMKDAGLVLPTDYAVPTYNGEALTYNPANDSYAGIDGVSVPRDDITVKYPNVTWRGVNDLTNLGLAGLGAGLYVDGLSTDAPTTTSTYDPATDITTSTTSGTTTTNVTTGESATTSATTTTTTGDTTGNPANTPEGTTPKTQTGKSNRWGKLVTTKFPFSLPWDLFFILSFLNADPKTPVFSIDERINKRENVEGIQIKFDIDLSFLDPYVPWFRRFLVLGFALFLILNTRKLLGGAQ